MSSGKLAENVMHFGRLLRGAGLPVGPDRVLDALDALQIAGVERRDDVYWTLASVFLGRRDQFDLFDQAFRMFWRDPRHAARVQALPGHRIEVEQPVPRAGGRKRVLFPERGTYFVSDLVDLRADRRAEPG